MKEYLSDFYIYFAWKNKDQFVLNQHRPVPVAIQFFILLLQYQVQIIHLRKAFLEVKEDVLCFDKDEKFQFIRKPICHKVFFQNLFLKYINFSIIEYKISRFDDNV